MSLACVQRRLQWEVLSPHEMDGSPQDLPVLLVYGSRDPVTENDLGAHSADQIEARQGWCDSAAFCRHVFNHSPLDMSKQLWQSLHGESERNDSKQSQQSQHSKHSKHSKGIPQAFQSIPKHSKAFQTAKFCHRSATAGADEGSGAEYHEADLLRGRAPRDPVGAGVRGERGIGAPFGFNNPEACLQAFPNHTPRSWPRLPFARSLQASRPLPNFAVGSSFAFRLLLAAVLGVVSCPRQDRCAEDVKQDVTSFVVRYVLDPAQPRSRL